MSLRQHFVRRKLAQKTNLSTLIEGRLSGALESQKKGPKVAFRCAI
jgi:hypothetical protein